MIKVARTTNPESGNTIDIYVDPESVEEADDDPESVGVVVIEEALSDDESKTIFLELHELRAALDLIGEE